MVDELFGKILYSEFLAEPGLLQEAVALGHDVNIRGFGTFERRVRAGRSYQANGRLKGSEGEKVEAEAARSLLYGPGVGVS